jgi:peptidoglycan/LPS O-acetylase OafA/YrhL
MPFLGLVLVGLAYSPSRLFNHSTFVELGDASYSLYLLHIPLLNWLSRTDRHLGNWQAHSPRLFVGLCCIGYCGVCDVVPIGGNTGSTYAPSLVATACCAQAQFLHAAQSD